MSTPPGGSPHLDALHASSPRVASAGGSDSSLNQLRSRVHRDTPISTPTSTQFTNPPRGSNSGSVRSGSADTVQRVGSPAIQGPPSPPASLPSSLDRVRSKLGQGSQDEEEYDPAKSATYDVNDCVEIAGWGNYHWRVISVMGMMSVADASEIWLTTIIIKVLVCEWGLSPFEKAIIPFVIFFWMAIGSIISGQLADKYGRWQVLIVVYWFLSAFSIASALAPTYITFLICRSIVGFCIGANYACSIVYTAEMVPVAKRAFNVFYLDMMWTAGSLYVCVAAYFVMDAHNGWRYLVLLTALPCVITLILLYWCDESPRYLAITNQKERAIAVLQKICKENNRPMPTGEMVVTQQRRGELLDIYKSPYTRTSIILGIVFFCECYAFYGSPFLIPDMMSYGYCGLSQFFTTTYQDERGCWVYTKAEYIFFMVLCLAYIPGYIISPITADHWGRKPTFLYSMWGATVVVALFLWCIDSILLYIEILFAITFLTIYIANIWLYIPEYYPTYIRSTGLGMQNGISKFGAALGTFATELIDTINIRYTIYTYIAVLLVAAILTCFLETETKGELLVDRKEDVTQRNYGTLSSPGDVEMEAVNEAVEPDPAIADTTPIVESAQ